MHWGNMQIFSRRKISNKDKFLDSINFFLRKNLISIVEVKKKINYLVQDLMPKKEFMNTKLSIDVQIYR